MITVKNEFETIPAFEVITGSSLGGFTAREMAIDLIKAVECVSPMFCTGDWKLLAEYTDDSQEINDLIAEYVEHLNYYAPIPDSCVIEWHDNELIVMPYMDDEIPRFEDVPESHIEDVIYQVSDHGNCTCYRWNYNTFKYDELWGIV